MSRLRPPSQSKHRSLQDPYAMINYLISSSLSVFALHSRLQIPENTLVRSAFHLFWEPFYINIFHVLHIVLNGQPCPQREPFALDKLILCMQILGK